MHLDTEEDQDNTNPKNIIEDIEDDAKEDHAAHSELKSDIRMSQLFRHRVLTALPDWFFAKNCLKNAKNNSKIGKIWRFL